MFRPVLRIASPASVARVVPKTRAARRFISTAPPHQKSRSWKSSAARWGLAGALVYYYDTTNVFAEEPAYVHAPPETSQESETVRTVASVSEERRAQSRTQQQPERTNDTSTATYAVPDNENPAPGSPEELEQEASQEGAFNEETGEINWDCPCLGGMAYGPCGEQFRAAFSCFVFSQEEPKGVDCIEHFKAMQNCFREHPDIYGAELDDDNDASSEAQAEQPAAVPAEPAASPVAKPTELSNEAPNSSSPSQRAVHTESADVFVAEQRDRAQATPEQVKVDLGAASDEAEQMPKSWHDARTSDQAS